MRSQFVLSLICTFVIAIVLIGCKQETTKESKAATTSTTGVHPGSDGKDEHSVISDDDFEPLISLIGRIEPDEWTELEPFDPPLTASEINDVLQQCLQQIFTAPQFEDARNFYGTAGSKKAILFGDWPKELQLKVDGFDLQSDASAAAKDDDSDRVLGIGLAKLVVRGPNDGIFSGNVEINLSNVGGSGNGLVIGGSLNFFRVERIDGKVTATYSGSIDP